MAETTLLRSSAIVRNASTGISPPHGTVKTGALSLVQVKMTPGGPQVQTPQQKPVEILPPRDASSAVRTGGLPRVNVKMTSQGPQLDDGQDNQRVVILPSKDQRHSVSRGGLPMVQVAMTSSGPQVQTLPNVQNAPPQIQGAPPALSQQRVARVAAPSASQPRVARIAAPQQTSQVPLPPVPELSTDQLMLCQHLISKYLEITEVAPSTTESSAELPAKSDAVKLAEATKATIDDMLVSIVVRAEAAAKAAVIAAATPAPALAPVLTSATIATSVTPAAPSVSYVAGRVGGRNMAAARGAQRNAAMTPRRVSRGGSPLPPVVVKMDGGRAVVQNQEEVAAARAAALAPQIVPVEVVPAPVSAEGDAQG